MNISGKLVLVDAATGAEQEIATPYATAGNPAWSPDGTAIACGLRTPDAALLRVIQGDYELYRVPRQGGVPVNLTNTTRDEFSPAVSPDGKRIAFVSNSIGNIDLFTMPVSGGAAQHIPIRGLEFRGGSGRARVRLLDEMGRPTSARLYVRAADGKAYCPPGSPLYFFPVDPGAEPQGSFIASGDDTFPVPAGPCVS